LDGLALLALLLVQPGDHLAKPLEQLLVGPPVAELVAVGHGDAGTDRVGLAVGGLGVDRDEVAARVACGKGALVTPRAGLPDFHGHGLQTGIDGRARHGHQIEKLVVFVQRGNHHAYPAVFELTGDGVFPRSATGPHRPADDLAEELVVDRLVFPIAGPAVAGVAGEGHHLSQPIGPARQDRAVFASGGIGRDQVDVDQRVPLDGRQDEALDRRHGPQIVDQFVQRLDPRPHLVLLPDQRPGHPPGLALEDPRQGLRAAGTVELAAGAWPGPGAFAGAARCGRRSTRSKP